MNKLIGIQGLIFDMDNTLLESRIHFKAMKEEIAFFLANRGCLPDSFPLEMHTTSTLLAYVQERGASKETLDSALRIAEKHELRGMEGADLEAGAAELIASVHGRYKLVIVTNNAHAAAVRALELTGIKNRFDYIVGREQMTAMKPSPSGYLRAKRHFPDIPDQGWLSIGDSWIDGRASMEAQIPFISYGKMGHTMIDKGVKPIAHIDKLLSLLDYV
ncbi:hypothetical protein GCM10008018_47170 [Paenibacillus marchantiophytorum]|uniref:HAD family hydrolase n=1 Tax=Paenibacillus marchantiophytorum TaxID=1619310 RepID=A0ABQ1F007_9BACL|nr:HAD family phosphatase [Paenibacillus marchantiophytorum]GFZ95375.1 hypothetical protein GCM10008018_47170 [Paenibacillus marchantiophytorum]